MKGYRFLTIVGLWTLVCCVCTRPALGQNANTGEIRGTVTDTTSAVVPGVAVAISNVQTGVNTNTTTNESGIYDVPSVPLGEYAITFSKASFRDFVRKGVVVELGVTEIDASLQLGVATERVEVTAQSPLVQTDTSEQHVTFNIIDVNNSPILGGVWYNELTALLPGVGGGASGEGVEVNGTRDSMRTGCWKAPPSPVPETTTPAITTRPLKPLPKLM